MSPRALLGKSIFAKSGTQISSERESFDIKINRFQAKVYSILLLNTESSPLRAFCLSRLDLCVQRLHSKYLDGQFSMGWRGGADFHIKDGPFPSYGCDIGLGSFFFSE